MEDEGSLPHPFGRKMGTSEDPLFPCSFASCLSSPPCPIFVLPVLPPSFLSHSALVFHTSSSLSYPLGSFFPSHLPCFGNLQFLTVEKHVFLSKLRMDAISLPELPRCSPRPARTVPKGPTPSTGVSCSSRRAPPETSPGPGSRCLACWDATGCLGVVLPVSQHAGSFTGRMGSSP